MGKAARKLNKVLQKNKAADAAKEIQHYRERVSELINEGKFSAAVDVLAEAATKKIKDVELMYDTAYCYFMVGDYERAGRWLNNVLTVSPGNKEARILLGRLCLMQDREEDGLSIFDYVLANWRHQLSEAELQEIGETLEYYGREMPEKIRANYTHVAELLIQNGTLGTAQETENTGNSSLDSVREKLAALKKLAEQPESKQDEQTAEAAAEGLSAAETVEPQPQSTPCAADTLARLKDKLAALKAKTTAQAAVVEPMDGAKLVSERSAQAVLEPADELEPEELTKAETAGAEGDARQSPEAVKAKAEAKRDEVMAMSLSLAEKVGALNNFAGAYFFAGAYQAAEVLLQAALQIDPKRPETIRNLALLLKESGNQEGALQCAARLPVMDFALLTLLRSE